MKVICAILSAVILSAASAPVLGQNFSQGSRGILSDGSEFSTAATSFAETNQGLAAASVVVPLQRLIVLTEQVPDVSAPYQSVNHDWSYAPAVGNAPAILRLGQNLQGLRTPEACVIYAEGDLHMVVEGNVNLESSAAEVSTCMEIHGSLTVSGTGTLEVVSGLATKNSIGLNVQEKLTIDGVSVKAVSGQANKLSVGLAAKEIEIVNGATVNSRSGKTTQSLEAFSQGVDCKSNLTLRDSALTAAADTSQGRSVGINCANELRVENSTVDASSGKGEIRSAAVSAGALIAARSAVTGSAGEAQKISVGIEAQKVHISNNSTVTGSAGNAEGTPTEKERVFSVGLRLGDENNAEAALISLRDSRLTGISKHSTHTAIGAYLLSSADFQNAVVEAKGGSADEYGAGLHGTNIIVEKNSVLTAESEGGKKISVGISGVNITLKNSKMMAKSGNITAAETEATKVYSHGVELQNGTLTVNNSELSGTSGVSQGDCSGIACYKGMMLMENSIVNAAGHRTGIYTDDFAMRSGTVNAVGSTGIYLLKEGSVSGGRIFATGTESAPGDKTYQGYGICLMRDQNASATLTVTDGALVAKGGKAFNTAPNIQLEKVKYWYGSDENSAAMQDGLENGWEQKYLRIAPEFVVPTEGGIGKNMDFSSHYGAPANGVYVLASYGEDGVTLVDADVIEGFPARALQVTDGVTQKLFLLTPQWSVME